MAAASFATELHNFIVVLCQLILVIGHISSFGFHGNLMQIAKLYIVLIVAHIATEFDNHVYYSNVYPILGDPYSILLPW